MMFLYFITGKKRKRPRLEDMHFVQSESDEDISPRKKTPHYVSSDNDLESHDMSHTFGKKLDSGRPHINDTFIT